MARAKICGLTRLEDVEACITGGAAFIGFVDFPKSPRHIEPAQAAPLMAAAAGRVQRVLLTVNATDARLDEWMALAAVDVIQVQGQEDRARIDEIKARCGVPVMKACGVRTGQDVADAIDQFAAAADWLLFEAKPPADSDRPGGNATRFDWGILQGMAIPIPWMLAGGLDASNVAEAIAITGARFVDVSSSVESTRGVKDATKIAEFLEAVEAAT